MILTDAGVSRVVSVILTEAGMRWASRAAPRTAEAAEARSCNLLSQKGPDLGGSG